MVGFIQCVCLDCRRHEGPSIASSAVPHANVCAQAPSSREIVEPPDIDVWTLPVDAMGEHELTLAVHREGLRYCYGYTWKGATRTMWPTIRVRRGEHFALRIVNDIPVKAEANAFRQRPRQSPIRRPHGSSLSYERIRHLSAAALSRLPSMRCRRTERFRCMTLFLSPIRRTRTSTSTRIGPSILPARPYRQIPTSSSKGSVEE